MLNDYNSHDTVRHFSTKIFLNAFFALFMNFRLFWTKKILGKFLFLSFSGSEPVRGWKMHKGFVAKFSLRIEAVKITGSNDSIFHVIFKIYKFGIASKKNDFLT